MKWMPHKDQVPYLMAIILIFILTILSVWTYKERMLFVDPAWIVFNIINSGSFSFAEHRYGAFITQIFPMAAVYMGFSLKAILVLYSLSFYLFYLSAALIMGLMWKQKWLAILLAIYLILFVSDGYYWPNNEVHQGITWMMLFIAYYLRLKEQEVKSFLPYLFLTIMAALAISSHLLVLIPLVFFWTYIHEKFDFKTLIKDQKFLVFSGILLVLMMGRYFLSNIGWYDPQKLEGVKKLSLQSVMDSFLSGQSMSFFHLLIQNYWIAIPIFIASITFLVKSKQFLRLALFLSFSILYYVVICITFPDAFDRKLRFYMESEWAGLSLIVATPMVLGFLKYKKQFVFPGLLLLLFGIRLVYIFQSYDHFHERLQNVASFNVYLKDRNIHKALIVSDQKNSEDLFLMGWGLPVESMLLSKLDGDEPIISFKIIPEDAQLPKGNDLFHSSFDIKPLDFLNEKYFPIDKNQYYHRIQIEEIKKTIQD